MRKLAPLLFLTLIAAKGGKKKDEPAPAPAPEPAPPAAVEEAAPAPVEEAPPVEKSVNNASFSVTITYADGSTKGGRVKGVERTADFYGDEGWTDEAGKLKLTVEAGGTEKYVTWDQVKTIAVTPGKMPDEVDCSYSSDFTPWMYECVLRTTAAVTLKDGSKGVITNRHQWRFHLDDGSKIEFTVYKYVVREQDERTVEFGDEQVENYALYTKLQDRLRSDSKTILVKSVSVQ